MTDILSKFQAGPDDVRTYLHDMFVFDEYSVATNGHLLVFRKCHENEPLTKRECPPTTKNAMKGMINDCLAIQQWSPFPDDFEKPEASKLEKIKCDECVGEGVVELWNEFNQYEAQCKSCDGAKLVEPSFVPARLLGVLFNYPYLLKFMNEEGLQIHMHEKNKKLYFKFREYTGVLMGMRES